MTDLSLPKTSKKKDILPNVEIPNQPIYTRDKITIPIPCDYSNINRSLDGKKFRIGDINVDADQLDYIDPCKIQDRSVLRNIICKFPVLHNAVGDEDLSHFTEIHKIIIFSKIPARAIIDVFNMIYYIPKNNNITIDNIKKEAIAIKKDKYRELMVITGKIEKQIDDMCFTLLSHYTRLVKTVIGKISEFRYKQHIRLMNDFENTREYDLIKSLYSDYLVENSRDMIPILKYHQNIFNNLKKAILAPNSIAFESIDDD
jgi:hypothetical protein